MHITILLVRSLTRPRYSEGKNTNKALYPSRVNQCSNTNNRLVSKLAALMPRIAFWPGSNCLKCPCISPLNTKSSNTGTTIQSDRNNGQYKEFKN